MTSNKTAITKIVEFINFRRSQGKKSVRRIEIQVAAEVSNALNTIVLDRETLEEIARLSGSTYMHSTGGNSKFVL